MPTHGFSIEPLKVKRLAGGRKPPRAFSWRVDGVDLPRAVSQGPREGFPFLSRGDPGPAVSLQHLATEVSLSSTGP